MMIWSKLPLALFVATIILLVSVVIGISTTVDLDTGGSIRDFKDMLVDAKNYGRHRVDMPMAKNVDSRKAKSKLHHARSMRFAATNTKQLSKLPGQNPHETMPMMKKTVVEFSQDFYGKRFLKSSDWRFPPGTPPSNVTYGATNGGALKYRLRNNKLRFTGDSTGAIPLRALQSFSTDVKLNIGIEKTDNCSSHYIVLSTNPNYRFNGWGKQKVQGQDITLLFGFNCNSKYIYGQQTESGYECNARRLKKDQDEGVTPWVSNGTSSVDTDEDDEEDKKNEAKKVMLGEFGNELELDITTERVTFKDTKCGEDITLNESIPFGRRFYLYIGADQDTPGKESAFLNVKVTRSNGCDIYMRERHPPLPRQQYIFWDSFETGECGMKWAAQGAKSIRNTTAEYLFGFDGAGTAEVGCQKNSLWFAGSSEGHTSVRIRRPFLGEHTVVSEISRAKRCSNHWYAVARSKRYQYAQASMVVKDPFNKKREKIWRYMKLPKNDSKKGETKWWYDDTQEGVDGKLWFEGSTLNMQPMLLKKAMVGPFVVKAGIQKTQICSSQYIVLTTNPYGFLWDWTNTEHAVKLVWNCDDKYIYGPQKNDTVKTRCAEHGTYDVEVHATDGVIRFKDNRCKELQMPNPFKNTSKVYILIGADNDVTNAEKPSSFSYFRVAKPEGASAVGQVVGLFGWQCNSKIAIFSSGEPGVKDIRRSAYCPYRGNIRTEIAVLNGRTVFRTLQVENRYKRVCPDIEVPSSFADRGIYYIYAGCNPRSLRERAEFRYFSVVAPPVPLTIDSPHTELYFADQFGSEDKFVEEWVMPGYDFNDEIGEKRFGLGKDAVTKEKFAWFMDTQIIPIRTKRAFQAPFTIVSDILRDDLCANHFITITSRKSYNFHFDNPATPDIVRFVYDCKNKMIISRNADDQRIRRSVKCNKLGRFQVTIRVQDGKFVFSDGRCESITYESPFPDDKYLYVFIGAATHESELMTKFLSFQIMGRLKFSMPAGAIMKEDFTQYDDIFLRMWTPDATIGAEVDSNCGSAKELDLPQTSLHFGAGIYSKADRVLTSTRLPFRRGGQIEFYLKYGGDVASPLDRFEGKPPLCRFLQDDDSVNVEFSTENAYDSYEPLIRLPAHHFGRRLRNDFMKIKVKVDHLHHQHAMTGNSFFRWKQEQPKGTVGRGDWAIDRILVFAKPPRKTKLLWNDPFSHFDNKRWWVPKKALKENAQEYHLDFSSGMNAGLAVSGSANGMVSMRTKRMFTVMPGIKIELSLIKDHRCSSHFVVLSKKKKYKWSWGEEKDTVKLVWNCEKKYLYAAEHVKSTLCPSLATYDVTIDVSDGKVYFADQECTELEAPHGFSQDDVFYVYVGADQDTPGQQSRFTNFTVYENNEDEDRKMKYSLMTDDLGKPNLKLWTPPKIHHYKYGYKAKPGSEKNGTLYFSGSAVGQQPLRTTKPFLLPFIVKTSIDKDSLCSNHFVVVTTSKRFRYRNGISRRGDAVLFGYDGASKYIFGSSKDDTVTVKCNAGEGLQRLKITVRGSMVVFEDSSCPPLMAPYPIENRRLPLYVMIGANRKGSEEHQCRATDASYFTSVEILGRKPVAGLTGSDEGVLLSDDFNFRMKADPSVWELSNSSLFNGRVDKDCGSVSGGSLHFHTAGTRVATTKDVDVQKGAEIDFHIRFGSGMKNTGVIQTSCTALNPMQMPADGVELQYEDETGVWHNIVRYDAPTFASEFVNFTKLTVRLDANGPEAQASKGAREQGREGIKFRWIQPGDNKKCCGHWAIDNVQIRAIPPLPESVEDDDFAGPNKELWHYPQISKTSKYKFGYTDTLWFSGVAQDQPTIRTHKRFPMGLMIRGTVDKSDKCSSHFIAISPDKEFHWKWGGIERTVVFAWNCNDKYIYSPYRKTSRPCNKLRKYSFEIEVQDGFVRFSDDRCGDLTLSEIPGSTIGPYYIHIGADQDTMNRKSKFYGIEILNIEEPIISKTILDDKFSRQNTKKWVYPQFQWVSGGPSYGYKSSAKLEDGRLWFSGDYSNETSIRTLAKYSEPLIIKSGLKKTSKCSSHYIALSTDPNFKWSWGSSKNALKFVWNCDEKYIYSPTSRKSTKCADIGTYNIDIRLYEGYATFTDGRCDTVELRNPFDDEVNFYVFIGADNDYPKDKSVFTYIRILKPETRASRGREIVMWDDFEFKDDMFKSNWDMESTTAGVDNLCSVQNQPKKSAMHFHTNGQRMATTKAMDIKHGADISFWMSYGDEDNLNCFGITDPDDGVELQYSSDDGKSWKRLYDYPLSQYGERLLGNGSNLTAIIDYDHNPEAMSKNTAFRFRQHKTNSNACCNQWAIGSISIDAYPYPEPPNEVSGQKIADSFGLKNTERKNRWGMDEYVWNIFNSTGRPARRWATQHDLYRSAEILDGHETNQSLVKNARRTSRKRMLDLKKQLDNMRLASKDCVATIEQAEERLAALDPSNARERNNTLKLMVKAQNDTQVAAIEDPKFAVNITRPSFIGRNNGYLLNAKNGGELTDIKLLNSIDGSSYKIWYNTQSVLTSTFTFTKSMKTSLKEGKNMPLPNGTKTVLFERIDDRGDGGEYNLPIQVEVERDSHGRIGHRTCQVEPNGLVRDIQHESEVVAEKVQFNVSNSSKTETINENVEDGDDLAFAELDSFEPADVFKSVTSDQLNTVVTILGNPNLSPNDTAEETLMNKSFGVRCCSDSGEKIKMARYGCHRRNYYEATAICEEAGLRLCTVEEMRQCKTCYMGCGMDNKRVWTSTGDEKLTMDNLKKSCKKKLNKTKFLEQEYQESIYNFEAAHNRSDMYDDDVDSAQSQMAVMNALYEQDAIVFWNAGDRYMTSEPMDLCQFGATVSFKLWGNRTVLRALVSSDKGLTWTQFDQFQSKYVRRWERVLFQLAPVEVLRPYCNEAIIRIVEERDPLVEASNTTGGNKTRLEVATSENETVVDIDEDTNSNTTSDKRFAVNGTDMFALADMHIYVGNFRRGFEADIMDSEHEDQFCYTFNNMTRPYNYQFASYNKEKVIYFSGDNDGKSTVRTKKTFKAEDSVVEATIIHSMNCSNNFIALSKDPYYKFDVDNDPEAVKFMYNCGTKVIIAGSAMTSSSVKCYPQKEVVAVVINITKDIVSFTDDGGCKPLVLNLTKERLLDQAAELDTTDAEVIRNNSAQAGNSADRAVYDCDAVKHLRRNPPSGLYWVNLGLSKPMRVFCDMKQDGGGWLLASASNGHDSLYLLDDGATLNTSGRIHPNKYASAEASSRLQDIIVRKVRVTAGHPDGKWTSYIDQTKKSGEWWKLFVAKREPVAEDGVADGNIVRKCSTGKSSFQPGEGNKCKMSLPTDTDESTSQMWGGSRYKTKIALLTYCGEINKGAIIMGDDNDENVICEQKLKKLQYPNQFVRVWLKFEKPKAIAALIEMANMVDGVKEVATLAGNPKCRKRACKMPLKKMPVTKKLAVRCCSNGRGKIPMRKYGCKFANYQGATKICRSIGARLCSVDEIKQCRTCGTGCGFDYRRVWTSSTSINADKKIARAIDDDNAVGLKVMTRAGHSRFLNKHPVKEMGSKAKLAVRCCSDVEPRVSHHKYGCNDGKTYQEAIAICKKKNLRLCTLEEVNKGRTDNTGCGFNAKRIWTSTVAGKTKTVKTLGGNPRSRKNNEVQDTSVDEKLAIRCCLSNGKKLPMRKYGCNIGTYEKAKQVCKKAGARLCTLKEVESCRTCGTGCGYDHRRIWTSTPTGDENSKDPTDDQPRTYKTLAGNPRCKLAICRKQPQDTPATARLAVRCCTKTGGRVPMRTYGCNNKKTFQQAKQICSKKGLRLCTLEEVEKCITCGTGCGYDFQRIWTSTSDSSANVVKKSNSRAVKFETIFGTGIVKAKNPVMSLGPDQRLAVRCCSDSGARMRMEKTYGCNKGKTYDEAREICAKNNLRLCTLEEVKAKAVKGTGCGFDARRIWTSTESKVKPPALAGTKGTSSKGKLYYTIGGKRPTPDKPIIFQKSVLGSAFSTEKMSILCCELDVKETYEPKQGRPPYGCKPNSATYQIARKTCQSAGKRLCSLKEMVGHSDWSNCNYDEDARFWTKEGKLAVSEEDENPEGSKMGPMPIVEVFERRTNRELPSNELSAAVADKPGEENIDMTSMFDNVQFFSENNEKVRNVKCSKCEKSFMAFYNAKNDNPSSCRNDGNWGFEFTSPVKEVALTTPNYDNFNAAKIKAFDEFDRLISVGKIAQNGYVLFVSTTASIKRILIAVDEYGGDDKLFCVNNIWWGGKQMADEESVEPAKMHVLDGDFYVYIGANNHSDKAGFKSLVVSGMGSIMNDDDGTDKCENMWDCEVSKWSSWTNCSLECDEGVQTRVRNITRRPENGGRPCPPLVEHRVCEKRKCNCQVSPFSPWSSCDGKCGGGFQYRSRSVLYEEMKKLDGAPYDGKSCPPLNETKKCLAVGVPCKEGVESHKIDEIDNITWCYQSVEELYPYGYEHITQEVEAVVNPFTDKAGKAHCNKWVDNGMMNCEMSFYKESCKATCWDIERKDMPKPAKPEGGLTFSGNATSQGSFRSRVAFQAMEDGLTIETDISKVHDCANHFIVVSTQNYFAWSATNEPDTIKFRWNCQSKYIIGETLTNQTEKCYSHENRDLSLKTQNAKLYKLKHTWSSGGDYSMGDEVILNKTWYTPKINITLNSPLSHYPPSSAEGMKYWTETSQELDDDDDDEQNGLSSFLQLGNKFDEEDDDEKSDSDSSNVTDTTNISSTPWLLDNHPRNKIDVSDGFRNRIKIVIHNDHVSFEDEHCGNLIIQEGMEKGKDFFVYLGAAPDENNVTAEFRSIKITGDGSVVNEFNASKKCPVRKDCEVTEWTEWSNCTEECEGGVQTRTRNITQIATHGGDACPITKQTRKCNMRTCDCVVSNWTNWTDCSKDCENGTQTKTRYIILQNLTHGKHCPKELRRTRRCNMNKSCAFLGLPKLGHSKYVLKTSPRELFANRSNNFCYQDPDDLKPYEYGGFNGSVWFKGYVKGRRTLRSRLSFQLPLRIDALIERTYSSNQFIALSSEHVYEFNWDSEPNVLKFGWSGNEKRLKTPDEEIFETAKCKKFKNNSFTQTTKVQILIRNGSAVFRDDSGCPPLKVSLQTINQTEMKDLFVYLGSDQRNVQILSVVPHNETSSQKFVRMRNLIMAKRNALKKDITSPSVFYSLLVSGRGTMNNTYDMHHPCPKRTDCEVSEWGEWGNCSEVCGGGIRMRKRRILKAAKWGGDSCPKLRESGVCNTRHCGVDCQISEWSPWGKCSKPCNIYENDTMKRGGGHQIRTRRILRNRYKGHLYGHEECPTDLAQSRRCNTQYCGEDCIMSEWTNWTKCSADCGGGAQRRYRTVLMYEKKGSHRGLENCPRRMEERPCNRQDCVVIPNEPKPIIQSKCMQYSTSSDGTFPYNPAKKPGCGSCVADPECGFCPNSGLCLEGNARGPIPRFTGATHILPKDRVKAFMNMANCSAWQFSMCVAEPCLQHTTCESCSNDPVCGWCAATNKCTEGDIAGSGREFCPRGWMVSPYNADFTKFNDAEYNDDDDFFPRDQKQQLAFQTVIKNRCVLNQKETEDMITQKVNDEHERQEKLRAKRERCYPCNGTWPDCTCYREQDLKEVSSLRASMVKRRKDESVKIDKSLPRFDKISNKWNYGQDKVATGSACSKDDECVSGSCSDGTCCKKSLNKCSGNGKCVAGVECECKTGYGGKQCERVPLGSKCIRDIECASKSCVRGYCCKSSLKGCSGKGECIESGTACKCDPKHAGDHCETLQLFKDFAHLLN